MEYTGKLKTALEFASEKHEGQYRKGGEDYIIHPMAVCEMLEKDGYGEDYLITALFHDLLEDTDATEDEIRSIAGEEVLRAVKLLTKTKGYVQEEYISNIRSNPIARVVKAADRLHNLRSAVVSTEEFRRKYILESLQWYVDLDPRIIGAVRDLNETLTEPLDI
ncbi:MAG: bifunctional (p)ppGpp synthetase/guanosine-3',5'-bis(diphosphate) 3'-pyrophosphohydrolase [Eubacteriaceae bacterium]|nr:bifunctional (p)ppGpp synthetase/guanosine-3',5'-bis(diphosphate) 3'-pyrophosphohydrolase [Eubacteriaceae bacterium]